MSDTKSCGYEGAHFGAHYNDATCIDGYLWDLDSYDDGELLSGGELACPNCNTEAFLRQIATELNEGIEGYRTTNVPIWEAVVKKCASINQEGTEQALKAIGNVSIISHFPRGADDAEYKEFKY